jgi:hypothetical protein
MSTYRVVVLTEREYDDLRSIISNGWGDGDFSGYGRANPRTQLSAMRHFDAAAERTAAWPDDGNKEDHCENLKDLRADQQRMVDHTYRTP